MAIAWVILSPRAFLVPHGSRAADFPILLLALAPPQALFGVNTEIKGDKGRTVKKAQHEVFKPNRVGDLAPIHRLVDYFASD